MGLKVIFLYILLLFSVSSFAETPSLAEVRSLYEQAANDEKACKKLIEWLKPYHEKNNPLLFGYRAGGVMMMANYVFNPFSKLSYFNKGKKMFHKAILADAQNIELRFIRFGVQTNAPSFLGYNNYVERDKIFLKQSLPRIGDQHLKNMIVNYFKKQGYLY